MRCFVSISEALVCHACLHRMLVQEAQDSMLVEGIDIVYDND